MKKTMESPEGVKFDKHGMCYPDATDIGIVEA
jgi:hypothetical protein